MKDGGSALQSQRHPHEPEIVERRRKERSPKRIINTQPHKHVSTLFTIKVPGHGGDASSLGVHMVYDPGYRLDECPVVEGRYFYKLIHQREILDSLRKSPRASTV